MESATDSRNRTFELPLGKSLAVVYFLPLEKRL